VLDAGVMVRPLREELVLDLDRCETSCLGEPDRVLNMHRLSPPTGTVQDEGERGHRPDLDGRLCHLRDREVRLGDGLLIAQSPATEVQGLESRSFREFRAQRIERQRHDRRHLTLEQLAELRASRLHDVPPGGALVSATGAALSSCTPPAQWS
jgi:hypothetical protein